jgi:MFS family permease
MIPMRLRDSPTFASLSVRNYRVYFGGQVVSFAGTWMQQVAQGILVARLTEHAWVVGAVIAMQFVPVLLFSLWAGVIADRFPKRPLMILTQVLAGLCAMVLGLLVVTDTVRLWMVFVMAGVLGVVQAFDNPIRQSFVSELVGPEHLANAISLNSVMVNLARIVGPAFAAGLAATAGLAVCFFLNAASFAAVILALFMIDGSRMFAAPRATETPRLREGLRYARETPVVFVPLVLMAIVGTLAYEFPVSLLTMAEETFGDPNLYGTMSAMQGAGAVVGGLFVASRIKASDPTALAKVSMVFGVLVLVVAVAPTIATALVALTVMGAASIAFISIGNSIIQLGADPGMRGRVMALWSLAFIGSTAVGGPLVGLVADLFGARAGVGIGGIAAILAGVACYPALARLGPGSGRATPTTVESVEIAPAA